MQLLCFLSILVRPILAEALAMWIRPQARVKPGYGWNRIAHKLPQEEDDTPPHSRRYLELADIALGLKKPKPGRKKPAASAHNYALKKKSYKKL